MTLTSRANIRSIGNRENTFKLFHIRQFTYGTKGLEIYTFCLLSVVLQAHKITYLMRSEWHLRYCGRAVHCWLWWLQCQGRNHDLWTRTGDVAAKVCLVKEDDSNWDVITIIPHIVLRQRQHGWQFGVTDAVLRLSESVPNEMGGTVTVDSALGYVRLERVQVTVITANWSLGKTSLC